MCSLTSAAAAVQFQLRLLGWGTRPEAWHGEGCDGWDHSAQPWVFLRIYRECFSRNRTFQAIDGSEPKDNSKLDRGSVLGLIYGTEELKWMAGALRVSQQQRLRGRWM